MPNHGNGNPKTEEADMDNNHKTVSVRVKRLELINLMIACTGLRFDMTLDEGSRQRWGELHDKLKTQLDSWDKDHEDEH